MRLIAHLSDLHFGTEVPEMALALESDIREARPDVVAVSGDLTQRARKAQFIAAKKFLERLPFPRVVVPGNHDIPLFDLPTRLLNPLRRYREHFSWDLSPSFIDEKIAVLGFNTVQWRRWKEGNLGESELDRLRAFLRSVPESMCRIVVTHHPIITDPVRPLQVRDPRVRRAFRELVDGGVELVLAGHLHRGVSAQLRAIHPKSNRSIVFAEAGTAISTRRRHETNGYNLIVVTHEVVIIQPRYWEKGRFREKPARIYPREASPGSASAPIKIYRGGV